ncbi:MULTISPECIES: hypothetical protein [unclassified Streptomyces]|uniref:hypothetical protein n=1 Tax=unclassified Streptomyces TaxID=2593676 RepID=UPI0033ACDD40
MTATSIERLNGHDRGFDPVALAEAEAIRTRAAAEAEAARIEAEGKAEAEKIKAAEEARKQRIANDKAEARAREEQAAREARIAKLNRERKEQERAAREAEAKAAAQEQAEAAKAAEVAAAEEQWRQYALRFYAVCSIVALPVQIAAFYNPNALWLMAAPIMLEGGAWVVLKGARAAAADRRPHWHYRLIAWVLAFIAAAINLWHGLHAFDPATAIGTAFASIAGPGVYDLHEHGQIRKRDGKLTRRQRKAAEKAAREEARRQAAEEKRRAAEKEAAERAAAEAAAELAAMRETEFEDVWKHARKLAAALGETTVTEAVWKRAHRDIRGADPGEDAETIRARNAAAARVEAARQQRPVSTVSKTMNAQRVPQVPTSTGRGSKTGPKVRGVRRPGDSQRFSAAARKQASITAKRGLAGGAE